MDGTALFNKIWVIESLREGDTKTGYNLVNDTLTYIKFKNDKVEVAYRWADSRTIFFNILDEILKDTKEFQNFPMIHVECHGSALGLELTNGEVIQWDELRIKFININIACRLNLVVIIAACNGAYFINTAVKLDRAPFWAAIGPDKEVAFGSIERNFGEFYREFFNELSGDMAMAALNQGKTGADREYHFFSSIGLYIKAYKKYHTENCVGSSRKQREEYLLTEALKLPEVKRKGISWARKIVKEQLRNTENTYNKYFNSFFMIDYFRENEKRFHMPFNEFLDKHC